jgi:hypothetical protein
MGCGKDEKPFVNVVGESLGLKKMRVHAPCFLNGH